MSKKSSVFYVKPSLLALAAAACASAAAQESTQTLSEVVVSASGFEQELKQAPASISVVTRSELETKQYRDLAEALKDVPGIDVSGNTGKTGGFNISMRGMPGDYTLILIDGRRQNPGADVTPNGFGEALTSLMPPMSAIERIEVIRGPMSTLYGSDAIGGIINIITRKVAKKWGGELTLQTSLPESSEDGATHKSSFYLNGPIKENTLGLAIRGDVTRREASDLIQAPGEIPANALDSRNPAPGKSRQHTLGAKLTLTPNSSHDFWLDVEQNRTWYNNDDGRLGERNSSAPNPGIPGYADALRFNRDQLAVGHTSRFAAGVLESSLMHNTTETIGRTIPRAGNGSFYAGSRDVPGANRQLESKNLVADTKFVAPLGESHLLTVGAQYTESKLQDTLLTKDYTQTNYALFAEDEWRFTESLAATFGGRVDEHDSFGSHFSPRAYLVWNATPALTFKGGVSKGFKAPDVRALIDGVNNVRGQGRTQMIGNPNLTPEISTSTEIAALFDNLQGQSASLTLFHNKIKDKISTVGKCSEAAISSCAGVPLTTTYAMNVDEAKTWGFELQGSTKIADFWTLSGGYTWTDSEVINQGEVTGKLSDTAKHVANLQVRWTPNDKLNVWLRGEYRGKSRRFDSVSGNEVAYAALGDLKAYELFHLGASYQLSKNITLSGNIYNLLDKNLKKYTAYVDDQGDPAWGSQYFESLKGSAPAGRTLWISAKISF